MQTVDAALMVVQSARQTESFYPTKGGAGSVDEIAGKQNAAADAAAAAASLLPPTIFPLSETL